MNTSEKKVLIVDDSPLFIRILEQIVNSVQGFSICGKANDAHSAASCVEKLKPDLLILDIKMPGIDGIHFLRRLIPQYPVPVIICTAVRSSAGKALAAGAADFVPKPSEGSLDFDTFKHTLIEAMRNSVNLREIVSGGKTYKLKKSSEKHIGSGLIVIGGSAGSTEALPILLKSFTTDMPPTAISIHMPQGYTDMYAKRLGDELDIKVYEASNGMRLRSGTAVIAPGAQHLRIYSDANGLFANVAAGGRISGHCPSVDALFGSAAELEGIPIISVLLTGMGSDGAKGLLKLKNAGAYTIGQDEKTSLVYGMPKAAYDIGAVCRQLPLDEMADEIRSKIGEWSRS